MLDFETIVFFILKLCACAQLPIHSFTLRYVCIRLGHSLFLQVLRIRVGAVGRGGIKMTNMLKMEAS
jgi:hypothetical protein